MMKTDELKHIVDDITKKMADEGKIIEAGWFSLRMMTLSAETSKEQLENMREAFFAGAQHLFGSIMSMLDAGTEPTMNDLRRMDLISKELENFIKDYKQKHGIKN